MNAATLAALRQDFAAERGKLATRIEAIDTTLRLLDELYGEETLAAPVPTAPRPAPPVPVPKINDRRPAAAEVPPPTTPKRPAGGKTQKGTILAAAKAWGRIFTSGNLAGATGIDSGTISAHLSALVTEEKVRIVERRHGSQGGHRYEVVPEAGTSA